MSLTVEQLRLRDGRVTASFAPYLMAGDEAKIIAKWRELVGDPAHEPEDLSGSWPVQFGSFIESFALDWHQRKTGKELTRRGEVVNHPHRPYVCCTLDAFRAHDEMVIDCKAIGPYRKIDEVCAFYAPQMVVQRGCVGASRAALLIVHGGQEPQEHSIDVTADYAAAVWERIDWFWACVESLTPPVDISPATAPALVTQWRQFDLDAMQERDEAWPNWAYAMQHELYSWKETAAYAKSNARATKAIKELLPDDVNKLTHSGVIVTRSKTGAVSIKEKED